MKNFACLHFINQNQHQRFIFLDKAPVSVQEKPTVPLTPAEQEKKDVEFNKNKLEREKTEFEQNVAKIQTHPDPKIKALWKDFEEAYRTIEEIFTNPEKNKNLFSHGPTVDQKS